MFKVDQTNPNEFYVRCNSKTEVYPYSLYPLWVNDIIFRKFIVKPSIFEKSFCIAFREDAAHLIEFQTGKVKKLDIPYNRQSNYILTASRIVVLLGKTLTGYDRDSLTLIYNRTLPEYVLEMEDELCQENHLHRFDVKISPATMTSLYISLDDGSDWKLTKIA
jgi:hypothetical protein